MKEENKIEKVINYVKELNYNFKEQSLEITDDNTLIKFENKDSIKLYIDLYHDYNPQDKDDIEYIGIIYLPSTKQYVMDGNLEEIMAYCERILTEYYKFNHENTTHKFG